MKLAITPAKASLFLMALVGLSLLGLFVATPAHAATAPSCDEREEISTCLTEFSPGPDTSRRMASRTPNDQTNHVMIISDHGNVPRIEVGMYWKDASSSSRMVRILESASANEGVCKIYGVKQYNNNKKAYSATYVKVNFSSSTGSITYSIRGDRICNNTRVNNYANRADGRSDAREAYLYGNFEIPASIANAYDARSDLRKVKMSVSWDTNVTSDAKPTNSNLYASAGGDQKFRFRAQVPGGFASNLETYASRNFTISGKAQGEAGRLMQLLPFGRTCVDAAARNQIVRIYDADNTAGKPAMLLFYVVKINRDGSYTPLKYNEYQSRSNPGEPARSESDINLIASGGAASGSTRIDSDASYPRFRPGFYDNKGGSTEVRIANMLGRAEPYGLVVINITTGGNVEDRNNFIDVRLPGDGIFGSYDFFCPATEAPNVSPSISFVNNDDVTVTQTGVQVRAAISNDDAQPANVTAGTVNVWYTNTNSDDAFGPGDSSILSQNRSELAGAYALGQDKEAIVSLPPIAAGYKFICATLRVTPTAPTTSTPPITPPTCIKITNRPFFNVRNGDVVAGLGPMTGVCTPNVTAKIAAWNGDTDRGYAGAGTTYAAQASDVILGFVTGQTSGLVGSGLSFANAGAGEPAIDDSIYGGSFGATSGCLDTTGIMGSSVQNSLNVAGGRTIGSGQHEEYEIDGDLYIGDDIRYGSYGSLDDIPSFKVHVKGNIYIAPSVNQLDGLYIAAPRSDGSGGTIYTCATNAGSVSAPMPREQMANNCGQQLTVYGSFVARQVALMRSRGDYRTTGSLNTPAEVFVYSPEQWLGQRGPAPKPDAIISLPPSL